MRRLALAAICMLAAFGTTAGAGAKAPRRPAPDTTPPAVTVTAPTSGTTVGGTITVAGSATDNTQLARVEVSVDGGAYRLASGTSSWTAAIDTTAYSDGQHQLTARATDAAGNAATSAVTVTVGNAPPPPPPPADTKAPTIAIQTPAAGTTLSGTTVVSGSASDDRGVAQVALSIDGGTFQPAQGTDAWSWSLNTGAYSDGSHVIAARATDAAGNATTQSRTVTIQNAVAPPPAGGEDVTTPEGVRIQIAADVTGWTAQQVYDLLRANALDLDRIGPALTVKVQTTTASLTSTSVSKTNGVYTGYHATIYLQAKPGAGFTTRPDSVVAHEYGHAWTLYHLYLTRQGDWSSYLTARGIAGDARVESTYNWTKAEMIADDYRMLFGTPTAVAQIGYINSDVSDPRLVAGLRDFLVQGWGVR